MYGFEAKETAEERAEAMRDKHPDRRYEVMPFSWAEGSRQSGDPSKDELFASSWGVMEYVKTDSQINPEVLTGFVWFER